MLEIVTKRIGLSFTADSLTSLIPFIKTNQHNLNTSTLNSAMRVAHNLAGTAKSTEMLQQMLKELPESWLELRQEMTERLNRISAMRKTPTKSLNRLS